jgi:hypothetical protein
MNQKSYQRISSGGYDGSSSSLSCDLTSLSCGLIMHRFSTLSDLVDLIEEARYLVTNLTDVFSLPSFFHLQH